VSRGEYEALGAEFAKSERKVEGGGSLEMMVERVTSLERQLGVHDLAKFTPRSERRGALALRLRPRLRRPAASFSCSTRHCTLPVAERGRLSANSTDARDLVRAMALADTRR